MDRATVLEFETPQTRRVWSSYQLEARAAGTDDDNLVTLVGMASVTGVPYPVMGGEWPGWWETIQPGAFARTLNNNADVALLVNHEGMTLARTKAQTMRLREVTDEPVTGLRVEATLDRRMTPVSDLLIAIERGDIDEMSFAFRVVRDEWTDDDGKPADASTGTRRLIQEVNLNKGDVSIVNYGANPATSVGVAQRALMELMAGRMPAPHLREALRSVLTELAGDPPTLEPQPPAATPAATPAAVQAGLDVRIARARLARLTRRPAC